MSDDSETALLLRTSLQLVKSARRIIDLTRERDAAKGNVAAIAEALTNANRIIDKVVSERDAAIAQRDRAVEAVRECLNDCHQWDPECPHARRAEAVILADTPIPDRLAAEREAGRREGIEAAAKVIEANQETITETDDGSVRHLTPRRADNLIGQAYAAAIRALRDTPAEGGEK